MPLMLLVGNAEIYKYIPQRVSLRTTLAKTL